MKFIQDRFGLPSISTRDAAQNPLDDIFQPIVQPSVVTSSAIFQPSVITSSASTLSILIFTALISFLFAFITF